MKQDRQASAARHRAIPVGFKKVSVGMLNQCKEKVIWH